MSTLKKEDLLKLKEQFKSTHNVLPSRFKDVEYDNPQRVQNDMRSGTINVDPNTSKNDLRKAKTSMFKLPGAENANAIS